MASGLAPPPAAAEAEMRVVCTAEEEEIFGTLLAAVRHFGARVSSFCAHAFFYASSHSHPASPRAQTCL